MGELALNHKDGTTDDVIVQNILTELLLEGSELEKVLFVGEGDFTFTVAFAALRDCEFKKYSMEQSMSGLSAGSIVSTKLNKEPIPDLGEVKWKCIASSIEYTLWSHGVNSMNDYFSPLHLEDRKKHKFIRELFADTIKFKGGVDACNIPAELVAGAGVIWFQCPWVPDSAESTTSRLVSDFLINQSVMKGVYVCIGITKQFPYTKSYDLEGILGPKLAADDNSTPVLEKYKFLGADTELVKKVLSFGYHHQSVYEDIDIHFDIIDDHLTLIFQVK